MDTKELYEGLLEITPPWEINRIEIDKLEKEVHVYVKYGNGQGIRCPECGKESTRYDERKERIWRHLDSCDYKTYIHCRQPRSKRAEHGIKTVVVPWAEALSRFT
jgi:transposase